MKLFSHLAAGCAQFVFRNFMPPFFGDMRETTEWTLRVFTITQRP